MHKIIRCYRFTDRCFKHATKSMDTAWAWGSGTCGLCCLRAYYCAHKLIRTRSYVVIPQIAICISIGFLLQIRMSWLCALSRGCWCWCWCCGPGCWRWCCELAEHAFETGGGAGRALVPLPALSAGYAHCRGRVPVLVSAGCACCPASRMSTRRGILPSYLGLCWFNFLLIFLIHCATIIGQSDTVEFGSVTFLNKYTS